MTSLKSRKNSIKMTLLATKGENTQTSFYKSTCSSERIVAMNRTKDKRLGFIRSISYPTTKSSKMV